MPFANGKGLSLPAQAARQAGQQRASAQAGRWHRAGNDPSAPISTRIPINPRPPIMHNFEYDPNAPVRGGGGGRGRGANAAGTPAPAAAPARGGN